jgi:hypothetical protein
MGTIVLESRGLVPTHHGGGGDGVVILAEYITKYLSW